MTLFVVQYHDDSWGAQQSMDGILGIYDSEKKAEERAEEFGDRYAHPDDTVSVIEYELNEKVTTYYEDMMEES